MERICGEMGVHLSLDAFADPETNILPQFWGPDSAHEDAFSMSWEPEKVGTFWDNPPYRMLERVWSKVVEDKAKLILICPNLGRMRWFKRLQPMVTKRFFIPPRTNVFETPGRKKLRETRWGVWAYLLDGALGFTPPFSSRPEEEKSYNPDPEMDEKEWMDVTKLRMRATGGPRGKLTPKE